MEPVAFAKPSTLESSCHFIISSQDIKTMAYQTEFASAEDVQKYQLEEIWDRYHKGGTNIRRNTGFRFDWTIDRNKNIYLMYLDSGREEYANEHRFLFWVNGAEILLTLIRSGNVNFRTESGTIEWSWPGGRPPRELHGSELQGELKLALASYGHRGSWSPMKHCTVICNF